MYRLIRIAESTGALLPWPIALANVGQEPRADR